MSLNISTDENKESTNRENGYSDRFGAVRTINKTIDGIQYSREFMTMTKSDVQSGATWVTRSATTPVNPEVEYEGTSKHRIKTRVSNSTELPGTKKVTPPLVTPLVDNGASMEEGLTRVVNSMGEQSEQMSIRMSELERAVHVEREYPQEEINRNRQKVSRNEERLKNGRLLGQEFVANDKGG